MTAADCIELLDEALNRFGTYAYYDKGPYEVLDVPALDAALDALEPTQVAAFLDEVFEHPHGHILAVTLLVGQQPRTDFPAIVAACSAELIAEWQPQETEGLEVEAVNAADFARSLGSGGAGDLPVDQLPAEIRQAFGFSS